MGRGIAYLDALTGIAARDIIYVIALDDRLSPFADEGIPTEVVETVMVEINAAVLGVEALHILKFGVADTVIGLGIDNNDTAPICARIASGETDGLSGRALCQKPPVDAERYPRSKTYLDCRLNGQCDS